MTAYLLADAGTSRTRVRLWRDGAIRDQVEERVGAKDVALAGHPGPIADALRRLVAELEARHPGAASALVCSGMITSNVGLHEVPHATAPIALRDLARRIERHDLPDVTRLGVYWVRGIKTVGAGPGWDDLADFDVLRGEEVEVAGLLALLDLTPPVAFYHCGSHHKLIDVAATADGADAVVVRSVTALTGELLAAIRERTILASSLAELDAFEPDADAVAAGIAHARRDGFARAAFLVRVGQTIAGRDRRAATSFLFGALLALDLQLLERAAPRDRELVLYGGGVFPGLLRDACEAGGWRVRRVDAADGDRAAAVGAVRLLEAHLAAIGGPRP